MKSTLQANNKGVYIWIKPRVRNKFIKKMNLIKNKNKYIRHYKSFSFLCIIAHFGTKNLLTSLIFCNHQLHQTLHLRQTHNHKPTGMNRQKWCQVLVTENTAKTVKVIKLWWTTKHITCFAYTRNLIA